MLQADRRPRLEYERGTLQGPPIISDLIGQQSAYKKERRTNKTTLPDRWSTRWPLYAASMNRQQPRTSPWRRNSAN